MAQKKRTVAQRQANPRVTTPANKKRTIEQRQANPKPNRNGGAGGGGTGKNAKKKAKKQAASGSIQAPADLPQEYTPQGEASIDTPTNTAPPVVIDTAQSRQSAYDRLRAVFQSFGLPDSPDILDVIKQASIDGDAVELVQARLQETASWKSRFAGNELRKQKNQNVLSVAEYLAQEDQYTAVLRNAGLPQGFYDDKSDFSNLIGGGVSVAELQDRVNLAGDIVSREDPNVLAQLQARGISTGMLLAHALDPERAAPLVKRQQQSILIGAAAARSGVGAEVATSDRLAELGINEAQATQGFGQINDFLDTSRKQGDIYGEQFGVDDAVGEVFEGQSGAKRKRLTSTERANFGGSDGFGIQRRNTAGSY